MITGYFVGHISLVAWNLSFCVNFDLCMPFADHTLEKREHLLREKRTLFYFQGKKATF